ncbi:MAG: DUF2141 domain-containing protein [Chitinophagaceae bacterium]
MKQNLTLLILLMVCSLVQAQSAQKVLNIEVTGLRSDKGKVLISVFASAKGFPEITADAVYTTGAKIKNGKSSLVFANITEGNYAIAVLHDENDNMKMDTRAFGIPKEGYGFSNNVMGILGPPSFKKASISYPAQKEVVIKIKY